MRARTTGSGRGGDDDSNHRLQCGDGDLQEHQVRVRALAAWLPSCRAVLLLAASLCTAAGVLGGGEAGREEGGGNGGGKGFRVYG